MEEGDSTLEHEYCIARTHASEDSCINALTRIHAGRLTNHVFSVQYLAVGLTNHYALTHPQTTTPTLQTTKQKPPSSPPRGKRPLHPPLVPRVGSLGRQETRDASTWSRDSLPVCHYTWISVGTSLVVSVCCRCHAVVGTWRRVQQYSGISADLPHCSHPSTHKAPNVPGMPVAASIIPTHPPQSFHPPLHPPANVVDAVMSVF